MSIIEKMKTEKIAVKCENKEEYENIFNVLKSGKHSYQKHGALDNYNCYILAKHKCFYDYGYWYMISKEGIEYDIFDYDTFMAEYEKEQDGKTDELENPYFHFKRLREELKDTSNTIIFDKMKAFFSAVVDRSDMVEKPKHQRLYEAMISHKPVWIGIKTYPHDTINKLVPVSGRIGGIYFNTPKDLSVRIDGKDHVLSKVHFTQEECQQAIDKGE